MGCDIHMLVETERFGDGSWWDFGGDINPGRDYLFFGIMAGVRDEDEEPIVEPRGLPEGMGYRTKKYYDEDSDLHSHTWLTYEEFAQAYARRMMHREGGGPPDVEYEALLASMHVFHAHGIKVRVIMAFDN